MQPALREIAASRWTALDLEPHRVRPSDGGAD
jgi:hypothetical protein